MKKVCTVHGLLHLQRYVDDENWWTQDLANEESSKEAQLLGEQEQMKYPPPPPPPPFSGDAYEMRRRKNHLKIKACLEEPSPTITTHFELMVQMKTGQHRTKFYLSIK
jgi:hypothetical protein